MNMETINISSDVMLCGYCDEPLGTLDKIIDSVDGLDHSCFNFYGTVSVDLQNNKIWGEGLLESHKNSKDNDLQAPSMKNKIRGQGLQENHKKSKDNDLEAPSMNNKIRGQGLQENHKNSKDNDLEAPSMNNKIRGQGLLENQKNSEDNDPEAPSTSTSCIKPSTDSGWSNEAVKLLITTYQENKHKFESPMYSKKGVWEIISEKLKEFKILKSGQKCDEKWRNLKKTYDKVSKDKKSTGNANTYWRFYDDFHEIYFNDPHFNPVFTLSSTGVSKKRNVDDLEIDTSNETQPKKVKQKDKPSKPLTAADIEARKQLRHEEKINQRKEMFEWFKENFKK